MANFWRSFCNVVACLEYSFSPHWSAISNGTKRFTIVGALCGL